MNTKYPTGKVLIEVLAERKRQDEKWGEQNHPMVGGSFKEYQAALREFAQITASVRRVNDMRVKNGTLGWDTILTEEVYEALSERDPVKMRAELVQVAAVSVAMIECIDRRVERAAEEG